MLIVVLLMKWCFVYDLLIFLLNQILTFGRGGVVFGMKGIELYLQERKTLLK